MKVLVLASASPRRRALLAAAGLEFEIAPADVDETVAGDPTPEDAARELALRKAHAALGARPAAPSANNAARITRYIVAADTVVGLPPLAPGGPWRLLGKPRDAEEAGTMLAALSGSRHRVVTGVAVARVRPDEPNADVRVEVETTVVAMRSIDVAEVESYVRSGEWRDKAGGYAIQESADRFVTALEGGGFDNVVGLPVARTLRLLARMGFDGPVAGDPSGG